MAYWSPIPSRPGTPLEPAGAADRPATARTPAVVRLVLAILALVVSASALGVAARPAGRFAGPPRVALSAYLPTGPQLDQVAQPDRRIWQAHQGFVQGLSAFAGMSAPVRAALDTTGDVHRPELAHPWLQVDLANPDNDGISTRSYEITGDQILFKALEFPRGFNAWNPGLPVLDTDLLAGRPVGWSGTLSSFDQGKTATSAATASISAAPSAELPGCVRTTASFTFADASTSTISTSWCAGERPGWAGDGIGAGNSYLRTDAAPAAHPVPTDQPARQMRLPTGGTAMAMVPFRPAGEYYRVSGDFGSRGAAMAGSVLVGVGGQGDVTGWRYGESAATESDWDLRWRVVGLAPVTAVTAVGQVAVVGLADRQVTAVAPDGWQLWHARVTDAVTSLVPLGDAVLVVDGSGRVTLLDAATGKVRWSVSGDVGASVSAYGNTVAVGNGAQVVVIDARTGSTRWTRPAANALVGVIGLSPATGPFDGNEVVLTKAGPWLVGRSAQTGSTRWARPLDVGLDRLAVGSGQVVAVGATARSFAADGRQLWSAPAPDAVAVHGALTALVYADRLVVRSADATVTWAYPAGLAEPVNPPVFTPAGIALQQYDDRTSWWLYS